MALHFELVTPEKLVRSEEVYQVVVPGTDGDSGVLAGHAPFMSTVRDGAIQVFASAGAAPEATPVRGGFAEVNAKVLTVPAAHKRTCIVLGQRASARFDPGGRRHIKKVLHNYLPSLTKQ